AVMWVQRHNVMDLLGWVAVFVLISLLVNVRTSVQIIDNSDLVKVHRVDNVPVGRSEEHTSELQSRFDLVCRLLLEKKNKNYNVSISYLYGEFLLFLNSSTQGVSNILGIILK